MPSVAIIGRPNVGKSALFNRLIGRKIAIVHDQPGITRDRISAICKRGTCPFVLWDTGGIFGAGEAELRAQVRDAAEEALHESDVLLFIVDAKEGLSPIDEELARVLRKSQKPVVLVINKIDNEKHLPLAAEFDSLGFKSSIAVSAEHGRGVLDLLGAIDRLLPSPTGDSRVPSPESLAVAVLGRFDPLAAAAAGDLQSKAGIDSCGRYVRVDGATAWSESCRFRRRRFCHGSRCGFPRNA